MSVEYCFNQDLYYDTDFNHCCDNCDCDKDKEY